MTVQIDGKTWEEELAETAANDDGWFDKYSRKGGWGKATNPLDVAAARKLTEGLLAVVPGSPPHISGDPMDGGVCLTWWKKKGKAASAGYDSLTVYTDSEKSPLVTYMALACEKDDDGGVVFSVDREDMNLEEAIAIVSCWLNEGVAA